MSQNVPNPNTEIICKRLFGLKKMWVRKVLLDNVEDK